MDFMIPFGHYWLMCMALMEQGNGMTYILLSSALGMGAGWFAYKPIEYFRLYRQFLRVVPMMFFGLCVRFAWDVIYKGSVQ